MKVTELFDKSAHIKDTAKRSGEFHAKAEIEGRHIIFSAYLLKGENHWIIEFSEEQTHDDKVSTTFKRTGSGGEFKVFQFVMQCIRDFIAKHDPAVIEIGVDKEDTGRKDLYKKMISRLTDKYTVTDTDGQLSDKLVLTRKGLKEGMMKRSDPYISGELDGPRPVPKKNSHDTKILNLAKHAGVTPDKVEQVWADTKKSVDMSQPNAYAIVMSRVQRALGLREALNEDFKHVDNEDGELTYGWKTDLEDEEKPGYIPTGYSKKVLELGGIFAATPGKGQGDKLMKLFLASPEAKKAELIFLDPVPGIGGNFNSKMSDTEQVRRLQAFYRRYGFRNKPGSNRMWLVKKGSIPDGKLPA